MTFQASYVILSPKAINAIDFEKKRGRHKIYLTPKQSIRYNKNKFFFQFRKGIVKFRGETPIELEGYKVYSNDEIRKITKSSQWKSN